MEPHQGLLERLKRSTEVDITVTGRKTGNRVTAPVWFVLEGGTRVILVPMKGSQSNWFRNLEKNPRVELSAGGVGISSRAVIVRDASRVSRVLAGLRAKYRSIWSESYYTKRDVCVEVPV